MKNKSYLENKNVIFFLFLKNLVEGKIICENLSYFNISKLGDLKR